MTADFLTEFFVFMIQIVFWYFVIDFVVAVMLRLYAGHQLSKHEIEQQIVTRLNEIVHEVEIDQHNDMYYWYDKDDRTFLAQGKNTEEIVVVLKQRFSDHIFLINETQVMVGPNFEIVDASTENITRALGK
jgi:hypothetical protein